MLLSDPIFSSHLSDKEGFFKWHQDTPHSSTMFGSPVIVFPTKHERGALMLQHGGIKWISDPAAMIQTLVNPSITYVSCYSNVKHEVTAITSGYHVTLTYNLIFSTGPTNNSTPAIPTLSTTEITFKRALSVLLSNKTFMEQGGFLGFGLQHECPLNPRLALAILSISSREVTQSYRECVASSAYQPISGSSTKIVRKTFL